MLIFTWVILIICFARAVSSLNRATIKEADSDAKLGQFISAIIYACATYLLYTLTQMI